MPAANLYTPGFLDSANLIADFYPRLEAAMERIWAPLISVEVPSTRDTEEYGWLGQVAPMRKWVGERQEQTLKKYSLTIQNFEYEATLPMSLPDMRRDKTGQLQVRYNDLIARTATHWNSLAGPLITNGAGSTSGLAYDGQYFFDTDHNESGSNQTNNLTSTEVPSADVATASTLTTTEAANVITETLAYMQSLTDDQSEPINQGINDVLILCTKVGHLKGVKTALGLTNLGTGSGNNNPILAWTQNFRVEYVSTRVTAADALYFFFGNPTMGGTPLIRQSELGVQAQLDTSEEFKKNRHLFGVKAARGIGYGQWQRACKVTLS